MRYAVAAVAAALLLGACSDEAAPQGSPPPSPSTSTAASPSAPTLPAAARGNTPQAAEAFVRHYVDLINHGLKTLDGRPLEAASAPDCEACRYFVEAISTTRQRSGRYEGGEWTIERLERYPPAVDGDLNVRVWLVIAGGRVVQEEPRDVATFAQQQTAYNFILVNQPSGFAVKRIMGLAQ